MLDREVGLAAGTSSGFAVLFEGLSDGRTAQLNPAFGRCCKTCQISACISGCSSQEASFCLGSKLGWSARAYIVGEFVLVGAGLNAAYDGCNC